MRLPRLLVAVALAACSGDASTDGAGGTTAAGGATHDAGLVGGGFAGGGSEGGQGGESGAGGGAGPECARDSDCPAGARCDEAEGSCHPACRNDFECGDSSRCSPEGGFCAPLAACASGEACAEGSSCNCHGVCEPSTGAPCRTDLQCPVVDFCDPCSGHCKARVEPCGRCGTSDGACERSGDRCRAIGAAGLPHCLRGCVGQATCEGLGAGYTCQDVGDGAMACVPDSGSCQEAAGCQDDSDCGAAEFCNEQSRCQAGCERDNECPNGRLCDHLRCVAPCGDGGGCEAPGECQPDGHCQVPGGCLTSADCPERETHCDLGTHLCAPGCERDADCLSAADECVDARCRPRGCTGNYQCAFAEICELATGLCQPAGGHHCESGCDPMAMEACGGGGNRCLSLQDQEGEPIGDFCFEVCQASPNECPQGYQCVDINMNAMSMGMPSQPPPEPERLCIRRCDQEPL